MTPEAKVLKSIIAHLETLKKAGRPIWWVKLRAGPWQQAGLPDLLVVLDGREMFFEAKAPGEVATPLQQETMRRIRAAGGVAEAVDSAAQVAEILEGQIMASVRCPKCGTPSKTPHQGKNQWYCHKCKMAFESGDDGLTPYGNPARIVQRQERLRKMNTKPRR